MISLVGVSNCKHHREETAIISILPADKKKKKDKRRFEERTVGSREARGIFVTALISQKKSLGGKLHANSHWEFDVGLTVVMAANISARKEWRYCLKTRLFFGPSVLKIRNLDKVQRSSDPTGDAFLSLLLVQSSPQWHSQLPQLKSNLVMCWKSYLHYFCT